MVVPNRVLTAARSRSNAQTIRPKVSDFGLAGFIDHRTAITMSGALVGTPSYMAPEQITGTPLGPQADVFSLGVMLYELITGSSPFTGESYVATIDRIQNHDPQPLTKAGSNFPRDLSAICECAISKEPLRRYSSAATWPMTCSDSSMADRFARSLGPIGRFQRWSRRHPSQSALAVVICIALLISLIQNRRLQTSLNRSTELQQDLRGTTANLAKTNKQYRETIYVQDMKTAFDAFRSHALDDVKNVLHRHLPTSGQTINVGSNGSSCKP